MMKRSEDFSSLEYGQAGVLASGKWFAPAAVIWMVVLFGATTAAFFASFKLPDWIGAFHDHDYACAVLSAIIGVVVIVAIVVARRWITATSERVSPLTSRG